MPVNVAHKSHKRTPEITKFNLYALTQEEFLGKENGTLSQNKTYFTWGCKDHPWLLESDVESEQSCWNVGKLGREAGS